MGWGDIIHRYVKFLAVGHSAATIGLRSDQLHHFAATIGIPPHRVGTDDLLGWLTAYPWCPETRHSYRSALRGFFAWAYRQGCVPADPAAGLPAVSVHAGVPRPTPDPVWAATEVTATPRTLLMLRLAAEAGLRRGEIAQLHRRDVCDGPSLLIHGKGGHQRVVPVSAEIAALIGGVQDWLFPNGRGGHLAPETVGELCSAALAHGWTLHSARHRFASRAYAATHDLRAIQELLGHASVSTTQRYVAVNDAELRAVAAAAI